MPKLEDKRVKRKGSIEEGRKPKKAEIEWLYSSVTLKLADVKKVRQMSGARFLTVLATMETGALRRYLLESGRKMSDLPTEIWVPSPTGLPKHPAMLHGGMTNHMLGRRIIFILQTI
jgi:hypothetical protein